VTYKLSFHGFLIDIGSREEMEELKLKFAGSKVSKLNIKLIGE